MIQLGKIDVTRPECCMCGDFGLSDELYRCRVCLFRSQHRYCSNQYPKEGAYEVCNWCLIAPKEDSSNSTKKAALNSSGSSSSHDKTIERDRDDGYSRRSRKSISWKPGLHLRIGGDGNGNGRVKKADKSSPEVSPATTPRKRIITRGELEEKLWRMKSEETTNRSGIIPRQVFRNKVRRYKLLEEVSS